MDTMGGCDLLRVAIRVPYAIRLNLLKKALMVERFFIDFDIMTYTYRNM